MNREILIRLKSGDIHAFDEIYTHFSARLFLFVLKLIKTEQDAEEIVQEVFVRVWQKRGNIDIQSSFESFLFTIAYNNTISLLRKRVSEQKYLDHLDKLQLVVKGDEIIDQLSVQEIQETYRHLLDQLSPRQKEIYLLSREEELTYREIAQKLNLSVNTVEIHMSKAIKFLKENLGKGLLVSLFLMYLFP